MELASTSGSLDESMTSSTTPNNNALMTSLTPVTTISLSLSRKPRKKPKILDEDVYLEKLEKIIQRDFFPDIVKLRAQNEYLDAVQRNDVVKIKQLQEKFSSRRTDKPLNTPRSPSFFETPSISKDDDKIEETNLLEQQTANEKDTQKSEESKTDTVDDKLGVDRFLYKYTSEDNASFQDIVDLQDERHRAKHAWMYTAEADHRENVKRTMQIRQADEQLALPAPNKTSSVDNWTYRAMNSVMFTPDGVDWSPDEMIQRQKVQERTIVHESTRVPADVFESASSEALQRAATIHAAASKGKVDAQGNEMTNLSRLGKYSLVVTPSPAPGVNESPMMTWGEIEGTPFRLDASDTVLPVTPGPSFKIPEEPIRDKLAHSMTSEIAKRHRDKKLAAMQGIRNFTPKFSSAKSTERLDSMSPAAKRLATSKLGIRLGTDKKLKASYTPSPVRTPISKTPLIVGRTPSSKTPQAAPAAGSERRNELLTDNLLNLPSSNNKPKASDFF